MPVVCKLGTSCCHFGVVGNLHGNIEEKEYAKLLKESWLGGLSLMPKQSMQGNRRFRKKKSQRKMLNLIE